MGLFLSKTCADLLLHPVFSPKRFPFVSLQLENSVSRTGRHSQRYDSKGYRQVVGYVFFLLPSSFFFILGILCSTPLCFLNFNLLNFLFLFVEIHEKWFLFHLDLRRFARGVFCSIDGKLFLLFIIWVFALFLFFVICHFVQTVL